MKQLTLSTLIASACLCAANTATAADFSNTKSNNRVDNSLMQLHQQVQSANLVDSRVKSKVAADSSTTAASGTTASQFSAYVPEAKNGRVVVDFVASGNPQKLLRDLEARGLENGSVFGRMVSGSFPVSQLGSLNRLGSLQSAAPALNSKNVGLVTTRGDISQGSDVARAVYGLDGSGLTVGSLSDSYDCLGGAAADVASNDLPEGVMVLADNGCSDEGRAMMQFIHDVAPGTQQAFHTAFGGVADFANGIIELQEVAGADIIVDDVIYFAEQMFQDGPIAQAAQQVADNGSAYFSSAGNGSFNSWEGGAFDNSGIPGPFGSSLHDFDPGPGVDVLQEFVAGSGVTFFSFQWDQPSFSASGGAGSQVDLDIFVFFNGTFIGLGGFTFNRLDQGGTGDPIEVFGINNSGPAGVIQIAIGNYPGEPTPNLMKYVTFGASDSRFGGGPIEYVTNSPTSYGHSNAANMAGVGAAAWFNTSAFNGFCDPACVNSFSALGGVPILFDLNDNPINEVRNRPNFVGPDGGNNTFFGSDLSFPVPGTNEPDGFPNFFGTSASAPHAAAAAALMLQANPSLTPAEIYSLLEDTATDMTADVGAGPGFDFRTGTGFINVEAAVDAAATDPRNEDKRFVCHSNRRGERTLSIEAGSVQDHLAHGDKFGPCE